MSLDKIIAKEMSHGNSKTFPLKYGINSYLEWIKWLEYIPKFETERRQELESKRNLTKEELDELEKYLEQSYMLELFKLYGTNEISKENYMKVYNYMKNNSLETLMLSKLTKEELIYAKEELKKLLNLENLELKTKILNYKENLEKLTMVDAYVFHMIS